MECGGRVPFRLRLAWATVVSALTACGAQPIEFDCPGESDRRTGYIFAVVACLVAALALPLCVGCAWRWLRRRCGRTGPPCCCGNLGWKVFLSLALAVYIYVVLGILCFIGFNAVAFPGVESVCSMTGAHVTYFEYGSDMRGVAFQVATGNHLMPDPDPVLFFGHADVDLDGAAKQAIALLKPMARKTPSKAFQVYVMSYRGYDEHDLRWPTQASVTHDAEDLFDLVVEQRPNARLLLAGSFMGAAVAAQLAVKRAQENRVAGLVLHVPFSSFHRVIFDFHAALSLLWPWIWLCDSWETQEALASLPASIPLLVSIAGADATVSPKQQKQVFEAASASRKCSSEVPGGVHTGLEQAGKKASADCNAWLAALRADFGDATPNEAVAATSREPPIMPPSSPGMPPSTTHCPV